MPISSGWPLPASGVRFFVPRFAVEQLAQHRLTQQLYPHGIGYYPTAHGHHMHRETKEHEDHLLMFCARGRGVLEAFNQRILVEPGGLILLPRSVAHQYYADDSAPWSLYWVHFDGLLSEEFVAQLEFSPQTAYLNIGMHPKIISDFNSLLEGRQTGYQLPALIHAANQLRQLLTYLALLSPRTLRQGEHPLDLDKVHGLMQERLHHALNLDTLAAAVGLSKFHFCKKYKALTGHSPIQHFIRLKMEQACYLLDISDQSVNLISQQLAYEDPHYFSRLFKKVIGISPSEYRDLKRG